MTATDTAPREDQTDPTPQKELYHGFMDFGYKIGLPIGGAITLFVILLLMKAGIVASLILSLVGGVALFVIAKMFFVH